ncbi:hypothetical protein SAMN04487851_1172 [Prevotella sp. tc2-28]|nr:hypothetical protein SAMN04487851_1172 [Prevotella sp. tc2-28]
MKSKFSSIFAAQNLESSDILTITILPSHPNVFAPNYDVQGV